MCMPTACRRPLVKCVFSRGWLASTQLPGCGWLFVSPSGPDRPADAAAAPALPVGGRGSGPRARSPGMAGSRGRSERRRGSANHGAGRAGGAPRAELMSRPPRAATGVPPPAHAAPPHRLRHTCIGGDAHGARPARSRSGRERDGETREGSAFFFCVGSRSRPAARGDRGGMDHGWRRRRRLTFCLRALVVLPISGRAAAFTRACPSGAPVMLI
jgi:hypothetical protein